MMQGGKLGLLVLLVAGTGVIGAAEAMVQRFRILVPEEAFVFIVRSKMKSTGTERVFESPALKPGRKYTYEISVIYEGQEVVRQVRFEPGARTIDVDFHPELEKLSQTGKPASPFKPVRPEWLPKR